MQVVEESSTSAVFSIAMVVVYDECIISEVMVHYIGNAPDCSFASATTCAT